MAIWPRVHAHRWPSWGVHLKPMPNCFIIQHEIFLLLLCLSSRTWSSEWAACVYLSRRSSRQNKQCNLRVWRAWHGWIFDLSGTTNLSVKIAFSIDFSIKLPTFISTPIWVLKGVRRLKWISRICATLVLGVNFSRLRSKFYRFAHEFSKLKYKLKCTQIAQNNKSGILVHIPTCIPSARGFREKVPDRQRLLKSCSTRQNFESVRFKPKTVEVWR